MKNALFIWLILLGGLMGQALAQACAADEVGQFDFWLGEWVLSWPAEQTGGEAGTLGEGSNLIEKNMDGCVIQENFSFADGSYRGQSWSVFTPQAGQWQQTWVDNSGAYLLFTGSFADGRMELRTEPRERDGKIFISRMVFHDITEAALEWDWQRSEDGGTSWIDVWNISYQRK